MTIVATIVAIITASAPHAFRQIRYGTKTSRNGFHAAARPMRSPHSTERFVRSARQAPVRSSIRGNAVWPSLTFAYAACVTSAAHAIATASARGTSFAIRNIEAAKQAYPIAHQTITATGTGAFESTAIAATIHGGFRFGPRKGTNGRYGSIPARSWRPDWWNTRKSVVLAPGCPSTDTTVMMHA